MIGRLIAKALKKSPKSILLLGPRQTGKSTLLDSLKPDVAINLANEKTFLEMHQNPGFLEERIAGARAETILVDEVQRLPAILNTIQDIVDRSKRESKPIKFFISGSSARKLKRGHANLLPGRIFTFELGPLVAGELDYKIDTRRALEVGLLPEPYLEPERKWAEKTLENYSATYLKEEIQAEALARRLDGFVRFMNAAALTSGQFLDLSKLAKQAKVARQTAVRFFEILEDTMIVRRIERYPNAKDADLVKHPRFYFFDTGVLNGLLGNFVASDDRKGVLFEHLIVNQLYSSAAARDSKIKISNFRTRGGVEIDFIVEFESKLWAIEVKSFDDVDSATASQLESACKYLPKVERKIIVTPSTVRRKVGKVEIVSWQDLLKEMGL